MVLPADICKAARQGDVEAIQEWFSTGTRDPDDEDDGPTLLYYATWNDHCDVMRIILAHGATVDGGGGGAYPPLHVAANEGHCDAASLLLDHGAQINVKSGAQGTPLIHAAYNGEYEMVRLLLRRGADINPCDCDGDAETNARHGRYGGGPHHKVADLLCDVRLAGGTWADYVRVPRVKLLALRVLCGQGRASTDDALLRRLFPAAPPAAATVKRTRADYRAAKGGRLPRGIFWLILEYWRSARDFPEVGR